MKIKKTLLLLSLIPFYVFSAPDTIVLYGNKNSKTEQTLKKVSKNEKNKEVVKIQDEIQKEIVKPSDVFEIKGGESGKADLQKMKDALKPITVDNQKDTKNNEKKNSRIKSKMLEKPPELPYLPNYVDIDNTPVRKNKSIEDKHPIAENAGNNINSDDLISYNGASTYKNKVIESNNSVIKSDLLNKMQQLYYQLTSMGLPMKVYIVGDNNPVVKNFVKKNVLKKHGYDYRDAFISELSMSAKINNSKIPVCYIYPKENISREYNNFFKDLYMETYNNSLKEEQIIKFLLGKELGYCLDALERDNYLNNNKLIYAKEAHKLGINSNLFGQKFAHGMRNDEYDSTIFFKDSKQLIYQNMIADIFGFLLSYDSKYDNNHLIQFYYNHDYIKNNKYHKNLIKEMKNIMKKDTLKGKKISDLWKISRNIQVNNLNK